MLNQSTYLQLDLTTGEPVSLTGTVGCEVRCMDGEIWITEENGGYVLKFKAIELWDEWKHQLGS